MRGHSSVSTAENSVNRLILTGRDVFSFKWSKCPAWCMDGPSQAFFTRWLLRKYGLTPSSYRDHIQTFKTILDAGCGIGRETIRLAKANPQAIIYGVDLSHSAIKQAEQNKQHQQISNVFFSQADITQLAFKDDFDFIFSEGVLHHTPNTKDALASLLTHLKPGGEIAFYVYHKKPPIHEWVDDYIRERLQHVSLEEAWSEMESLTHISRDLSESAQTLTLSKDFDLLGLKSGRYPLQRWIYQNVFKCFWNNALSFQENVMVNFDWYLPPYAWRHTEEDVLGWLNDLNLKLIWKYVEESGITVRAVKRP